MKRSTSFALATLVLTACGAASAQGTAPAMADSADTAASGMQGKGMKHSGAMKKDGMTQHEASDQNTARSTGASILTKAGTTKSGSMKSYGVNSPDMASSGSSK